MPITLDDILRAERTSGTGGWEALLRAAGAADDVLSAPGDYTRGAMLGQLGRVPAGELLKRGRAAVAAREGYVEPNRDPGFLLTMVADALTDPTNLIGAGLVGKTAKEAKRIEALNALSQAKRAQGWFPEENIAKQHPSMLDGGLPRQQFHGSPYGREASGLNSRMAQRRTNDSGWYGDAAAYMTPDRIYAEGFAFPGETAESLAEQGVRHIPGKNPAVTKAFVDVRNPYIKRQDVGGLSDMARELGMHDEMIQLAKSGSPKIVSRESDVSDLITKKLRELGHDAVIASNKFGPELAVFDPSQIYSPYIAPALKDVPSNRKKIEAMLLYNAMRGGGE